MKQRLIDANRFWEMGGRIPSEYDPEAFLAGMEEILSRIRAAPTVDAVEVVRCKDCRSYDWQEGTCKYWEDATFTEPDNYCSYGERKDYD